MKTGTRGHGFGAAQRVWVAALVISTAIVATSCGAAQQPQGSVGTAGKPISVTLWHSMLSPVSGALQRIVDQFNQSQSTYHVNAVFQGDFTESLNKLIASGGSENIPSLIQLDDVSTQTMIDSGVITPVQNFVDKESFQLGDFEPKALDYYRVNGTLYSMPFNLADPILYYDRQDFINAGLDPNKPPRTLEEVRQYAQKLVVRDDQGKIKRYGIALEFDPWFFEQMLAEQGTLFVDNGNGRDGRATKAVFDSPEGVRIIKWWHDMVADGLAYDAGQRAEVAVLALAQDRASMTIESTALLGAAVALAAVVGDDPHRIGIGPFPAPQGANGGIIVGGASLWILKNRPKAEQQGAWEFTKFATQAERQAQWHADTGYLPVRISAYGLASAVQRDQQFPQFLTAVDQLHSSPNNKATQGAILGDFNGVRDVVIRAFQQMLAGGDPTKELERAAKEATGLIQAYNQTAQ